MLAGTSLNLWNVTVDIVYCIIFIFLQLICHLWIPCDVEVFSRSSDLLRTGMPEVLIPAGIRGFVVSKTAETGCAAHLASCSVGPVCEAARA